MKASYLNSRQKPYIDIARVLMIHYFEYGKNFVFDGESHNYWEMVYVDKGQVAVKAGDDEEIVLSQGEVVFHCPNEFHSIRAYNSSPNFFVVCFTCKSEPMKELVKYRAELKREFQPFISSIIKEAGRTYSIPKNDPDLQYMPKREGAESGGEQLIKTYLEQLLILLLRDKNNKGASSFPSKESADHYLVSKVKEYINENADGVIYVSDVCRALGYSKSYLSKIFKEERGETIQGYVTEVKIVRAKNLIREGSYSFAEISDKLSFDNPQYFSRVFKRVTGMTPTEFKLTLKL